MTGLKSWRELLATPLPDPPTEDEGENSGDGVRAQTAQTAQTSDSLRVGLRTEESANRTQTSWLDSPRLVRTGPNTWVEADWCKGMCVFCSEPLAEGNKTRCVEHQRQADALVMPWEVR